MVTQMDAECLLAHVLGTSREHVIAHGDDHVSCIMYHRFRRLIAQRARGVPLAYLTGHKEFYGLDFVVNKHTLIPRPETELLVELAVDEIKSQKSKVQNESKVIQLIDIGTGSGCIPIAIEKACQQISSDVRSEPRQHVGAGRQIFATDISRAALRVAKKNGARHGAPITFLRGNLLEPVIKALQHDNTATWQHVIITANLPYLTQKQINEEPSIQHEPTTALLGGGKGGLILYQKLLNQIQSLVSSFQFPVSTFMEIDPSQSAAMRTLILQQFPQADLKIKKDLAGCDRVAAFSIHKDTL